MKETINYEYKDSLFKILFGEYKENALSLYNALSGKDYNDPDALIITTLKNAVYIGRKNDVSFIIESDMVLNEHQSSQNPNMPLRGLEYFAELYSNYINKIPGGRKRLYSSTLVIIPAPKYFVLYNGKKKIPERHILKLSDAYEGEGDIEVIAHVININKGCNPEVMGKCTAMANYAELIERIRENRRNGLSKEDAIEQAIESCIKEGIMAEILNKEKNRVRSSLLTALTDQETAELYEGEGLKKGMKKGLEQGLEQGRIQIAENMLKDDVPIETIAKYTNLSAEEIERIRDRIKD